MTTTTDPTPFWQQLEPPGSHGPAPAGGWRGGYPASLPDGRQLLLPLRVLPGDGTRAVASLIINQAAFTVADALVDAMVAQATAVEAEVVVGVPTLGLIPAAEVARRLGHRRFVALGTSRKFWYDDALSVPLRSITSPQDGKRLYLDPRLVPLVAGRRVLVVDDVISTGRSVAAALALMAAAGAVPAAVVVAMVQTARWMPAVEAAAPGLSARVFGAIASPGFTRDPSGGWVADA